MRELYGRSRRTVALALALVLLLTLLLSAAFMLLEVGHACHGAHCAVCERILMLQGLLHQLGLLALALLALRWYVRTPRAPGVRLGGWFHARTLVWLRIRMNN